MALLSRHVLQGFPLDLPGFVVEEDADKHKDGAGGAEDGDLITEHDDTQPHGQGVLDSAGNTRTSR